MLDKRNIKLKYRGSENQRVIDVKESLLKGAAITIEEMRYEEKDT